jgi:ribosomal protein L22
MSEEKPKRRRRRKAEASEPTPVEAGREEAAEDARSAEEGPVAPQAGVQDESEEATSADEGPVAPQAGVQDEAADPEADDAPAAADSPPDETSHDEEGAEAGEGEPASQPTRRRRGSAETGGGRRRAPRRDADGDVMVRARARYVRCAPRKARLVVDHIRGKRVDEARAILRHTTRHAARDVLKLLESCVANAESEHELVADELVVHQVYVDEGPTIRRYRPRAYGRATRINKRTSHMTLTLTPTTSKE